MEKQKVLEKFSLTGPKSKNLNNSYLLSEMANFDYDFGFE
jgi:hypothetical protein